MIARGTGFRYYLEMLTTAGAENTAADALTVTISKDGGGHNAITTPPTQVAGTHIWTGMTSDAEATADVIHIKASRAGDVTCSKTIYTENVYTAAKAGLIDASIATVDTVVDAIKLKTDNLPGSPAAVGSAMTLDAATHTAIAADTQTGLTDQGYTTTRAGYLDTLNNLVANIWDRLTSALTTVGSIGKLLVDNVNATVVSRASSVEAAAILQAVQDIGSYVVLTATGIVAPVDGGDIPLKTGQAASWLVYQDALVAGAVYRFAMRYADSRREIAAAAQVVTFAAADPGDPGAYVGTVTITAPAAGSYVAGVGYADAGGDYQAEAIEWTITVTDPAGPESDDFS